MEALNFGDVLSASKVDFDFETGDHCKELLLLGYLVLKQI